MKKSVAIVTGLLVASAHLQRKGAAGTESVQASK
jgi:hypothetical protein